MNHRERILAALNHQAADRVPVDLGGMGSTGIMAVAYARLRDHLGLPDRRFRINDVGQQLAEIDLDVLEWCQADVLNISRTLPPAENREVDRIDFPLMDLSVQPPTKIDAEMLVDPNSIRRLADGWELIDRSGAVQFRKPDSSYYFERTSYPLAEAETIRDIRKFQWEIPGSDYFQALRERTLALRQDSSFALMGSFGGNILEQGQSLRGWDRFMIDLALGGAFRDYLLDYMAEKWMEHLEQYLQAVGDLIDVIVFGDDLGTQQSPQMSLPMYRETIHPRHKRLYSYVREHYSTVHVFLHSCGAIRPLIPLLIDEGVQILNPVQTSASGMDPVQLKKEFGKDLVFWGGGVDTQKVLPLGTPDEVKAMVNERLDIFCDGGGYVFCPVHNIQANVPCENIVAMYEAVAQYPIGI